MNKRTIEKLIYLSGVDRWYTVHVGGFDGMWDIHVPTVRVGHAIVRSLREQAALRPDLFPPSSLKRAA